MCGILGGNNRNWDYKKGIESIRHRGPDACRTEEFQDCTLAFARLAIMDLSENGMQPMTSMDGNVTIVYNGEIYGYTSLKRELEKKYRFRSSGDTEVILNAYMEYGDGFIDKIDGMFAIAIYDRRTMELKLYRDRAGIKPLYYYCNNGRFAFASEIKALEKACGDVAWRMDYTALYDYLFYQYIPEPKTMYMDCYKLLPAHVLVYDLKNRNIKGIHKYWKLHVNTAKGRRRKEEVLCEELRSLLSDSVRQQLIADVPVGCFLSGGVDSSIISYECNQYSPDIHTYTIGFKEKLYDESGYADIMTAKYGLNCSKKILEYKDIEGIKGRLRDWYDEPFADTSAYPSYLVSELARRDVTVVLTGDGGDELFGGYHRYRSYVESLKGKKIDSEILGKLFRRTGLDGILPEVILRRYVHTGLDHYIPYIHMSDKGDVESYRKKWGIGKDYDVWWHLRKYYRRELPPITRARYLDFKTYLPGDILTKVDRVSMANSLEARVPFLGRRLMEFAFSLSEEECCSADMLKRILKKSYEDVIPKELLYREKKGFAVPANYFRAQRRNTPITCEILKREWNDEKFI